MNAPLPTGTAGISGLGSPGFAWLGVSSLVLNSQRRSSSWFIPE
ncbi:hypothetical protein BU14_0113s0003 [Porphyra umbilicalis]|uniref:Uncharacterized protein n=1 Tax=Porphyra umbilicalis TaxID=2786 RepID=A0A1X6PBK9_PORUM|nr:hypothetical protein BU14_0113s0003 [Porphyra umbilicalis]|eukprot:OSX78258.1 hypothetical protein BU14_0113s0003 [Porphyra umbilicalis]